MIAVSPASATRTNVNDAELVAASREGDRQAFGQIVRRYQGMVSGLIYAACGDLHRSEDLAQETFLSAWKSLSGLREPEKLPAWLCQIARHRTQDQQRRNVTEKAGIGVFWDRQRNESNAAVACADEELLRKEEEAVLWRALAEIPQPYRETLVLYYRQGQSTDEVAAATETSEGAVRQRLSRGREMLRAEVSEMLERNLTRSAPTPAFALAVVAALPSILPEAGAAGGAAGVGSAVKGSLGVASSGWIGALTPWLGPIGGLASGVTGSRMALQDDHTPDERRLTVRFLVKLWLLVPVILGGCFILFRLHWQLNWSDDVYVPVLAGFFALCWGAQAWLMLSYQGRSSAIRDPNRPLPTIPLGPALFLSAGTTISVLGWMLHFSLGARDYLASALIVGAIAVLTPINAAIFRRRPRRLVPTVTFTFMPLLAVILSWRLDAWVAASRGVGAGEVHLPIWSIDVAVVGLVVWVWGVYRMFYPKRAKTNPEAHLM